MDLDGIPEGWRPTDGDTLIGTVLEVTKGWSDYTDSYYPIVVLKPADGSDPVSIHAFHAVLRNRLSELRPVTGETLGVKYVGKVKSKDGKRDVTVYNVKVEGRTGASVWDDVTETPRANATVGSNVPVDDDIPF